MSTLTVSLDEETMDKLAEKIARLIGGPATNEPLSLQETADRLGVSRETIRLRVKAGRIPKVKDMGSRVLIPRKWVEEAQDGSWKAKQAD